MRAGCNRMKRLQKNTAVASVRGSPIGERNAGHGRVVVLSFARANGRTLKLPLLVNMLSMLRLVMSTVLVDRVFLRAGRFSELVRDFYRQSLHWNPDMLQRLPGLRRYTRQESAQLPVPVH